MAVVDEPLFVFVPDQEVAAGEDTEAEGKWVHPALQSVRKTLLGHYSLAALEPASLHLTEPRIF